MTDLTRPMIEALKWFEKTGPVAWFSAEAPSRVIRKRLEDRGLIESAGIQREYGLPTGVNKYQISAKGRAALATPLAKVAK